MTLAADGLQNAKSYKRVYADAAARTAFDIFDPADIGTLAYQQDDGSLWVLHDGGGGYAWAAVGGGGGSAVLPTSALLFPFLFRRGAGEGNPGVYYYNTRGDMPFNLAIVPDGIGEGNTFTHTFPLAPGSYTFAVLGIKNNGMGTITWNLDGTDIVAGQDWYDPAEVAGVQQTAAVTVSGTGAHTLRWTMVPKNPASADNIFALTAIWFRPA